MSSSVAAKPKTSTSSQTKPKSPSSSSSSSAAASSSTGVKRSSGGVSSSSKPKSTSSSSSSSCSSSSGPSSSSSSTSSGASKAGITKGVSKLKVSESSSSSSSTAAESSSSSAPSNALSPPIDSTKAAVTRRRLSIMGGTDAAQLDGSDPAKAGAKSTQAAVTRRRLSIMGGAGGTPTSLDGMASSAADAHDANNKLLGSSAAIPPSSSPSSSTATKRRAYSSYATLSKVGYVPFNANKVNQDRYSDVINFAGHPDRAFFAVFDGHGAVGHEVSQFCSVEIPKSLLKQPAYASGDIHAALDRSFLEAHERLATSSSIDCTFSGTTAIAVYIANGKLYSANSGDSRAVLARFEGGKYVAIPLSSDHKPERPDEKERIIKNKGRVEACKGPGGEDIGPSRVWLLRQDVPGLAMTRSIGDLVAASVGVSAKPEIWERDLTPDDKFMILASDGVWEFISNQEAVDIVTKASSPQEAVKLIVDESVRRWRVEEEVVDDITAVLVYF